MSLLQGVHKQTSYIDIMTGFRKELKVGYVSEISLLSKLAGTDPYNMDISQIIIKEISTEILNQTPSHKKFTIISSDQTC